MLIHSVALALLLPMAHGHLHNVPCRGGPFGVARVLGFSEDGTHALVEEHEVSRVVENGRPGAVAGNLLRYVILGPGGREVEVTASNTNALQVETVDRDTCRAAAHKLETALAGFRSVRVRVSGCADTPAARTLVDVVKTVPTPLVIGSDDMVALQKEEAVIGDYFVNETGPLVVVISPDLAAVEGKSVTEHVYLRANPRINKRWPDPAP